jgi:hypothetical protein
VDPGAESQLDHKTRNFKMVILFRLQNLFDPWIRDPRWVKKQDLEYISENLAVLRIRDLVPFRPLDPDRGYGIGFFFRILDLGSRIPNSSFQELFDKFLVKKVRYIFLWKLAQIFFFSILRIKYFTILWNLWLLKKEFFTRDPGSEMVENQDLGSGINIPDPQHWNLETILKVPSGQIGSAWEWYH